MKLLSVWIWESIENLPLIFGFIFAIRLWDKNIIAGLVALILGMGLGVLVTRYVEPYLHMGKHTVSWTSTIVNFVLFVALAIPFVYYFRADTRWINWKTDLLAGLAAGLLLTFMQSLHWTGPKSRMILHGMAMTVSFPIIIVGLRYIVRVDGWSIFLLSTFLLVMFASFIISLIDYQEMFRKAG
jgi:branched-subunit amino acid transport protein